MKALFFDIDGTLTSKQTPQLTPQLIKALNILRSQGIKLFISTGRHMSEIHQLGILEQFQYDGYITINGAYCTDGHKVIHKENIPQDDVIRIHNYFNQHHLSSLYVEREDLYANRIDEKMILSFEDIHTPLPEVRKVDDIENTEIYLFCPFASKEEITGLMKETKHCVCTQWFDTGYDVFSKNCSKSVGIEKVLEYYGIAREDTMAFGDGMNDKEMLELVKIGVAMGNAKDEIKSIADYVTDDVNHDGIIKALEHFGLIERGIL